MKELVFRFYRHKNVLKMTLCLGTEFIKRHRRIKPKLALVVTIKFLSFYCVYTATLVASDI